MANSELMQLKTHAVSDGMRSLRLSDAHKIAAKQTTIKEILRVTSQNQQK